MARNQLSENQIKKLFKDHDPEKVERHNDGDGLIFEMRKKGQPRWVFRYTKPSGGVTEKSLGPWPTLSIAEAREQADELRAKLLKGDDPAAPSPTAEKKTLSLEDMAGEFLDSQTWSAKHRETVVARLKYIPQSVRAMPLDQISPRLLMEQVLRPLEQMSHHGFRSSASSILNASGLFSEDAIERQLAHVPENKVRGIYNRADYWDERVRMMEWWGELLMSWQPISPCQK